MSNKITFPTTYTYNGSNNTKVSVEEMDDGFFYVKNEYGETMYTSPFWELCLKWIIQTIVDA